MYAHEDGWLDAACLKVVVYHFKGKAVPCLGTASSVKPQYPHALSVSRAMPCLRTAGWARASSAWLRALPTDVSLSKLDAVCLMFAHPSSVCTTVKPTCTTWCTA